MSGALVTGAGRGLGREIALRLARRGYVVHVTDVDEVLAAEAAREIGDETGADVFGSALDVRDADDCRRAAQLTSEWGNGLDLWVNNAGVLVTGPAWEATDEARRLMFEVNALGTMHGTFAALEQMRPVGRGHVVNIASLAGLAPVPGEAVYAATKHAVMGLSLSTLADLRVAGERGIHISCVCPDGMWTPMLFDRLDDPGAAMSFSGKLLQPGEVADLVERVLDRPRPVATSPRWRGAQARAFDLTPRLAMRASPLVVRMGRLKQRSLRKRLDRTGTMERHTPTAKES
jgi:NAD(P)-dependent dehydrogenase (short-subunit alcohol dehydrogenase family)